MIQTSSDDLFERGAFHVRSSKVSKRWEGCYNTTWMLNGTDDEETKLRFGNEFTSEI